MQRGIVSHAIRRYGRKGAIAVAGAALALTGAFAPTAASAHPSATAAFVQQPPANAVVISSESSGPAGLGRVLVDSQGFSLYDFTGDGFDAVTGCLPTNMSGGAACTDAWIPLQATGPVVAGPGVNPHLLGTVTRTSGITQVTYAGEPLYTFVKDTAPGQMNGQDVAAFMGIWRLVSTVGGPAVDPRVEVNLELSAAGPVLDTPTSGGTTRSLYVLSADPARQTTCTGECAAIWPPLLTSRDVVAGPGVSRSALGVIRRPDGHFQVTYQGKPVYFFAIDIPAGAPSGLTSGDNFVDPAAFGVWDTLSAAGTPATGPITLASEAASDGSSIVAADGNSTPGGAASATVYAFSGDSATASACNGACAVAWPPVLTSATPVAGAGLDPTMLGSIQRPDGSFQLTYGGKPLYYFSHALDTTQAGNGVAAFGGTFSTVAAA